MNFHKWLIGSAIAVSAVALAACGSDSSSSSGDNGSSSSSGTKIPVTSDSSWVAVSNFNASISGSGTVSIGGSAYIVDSLLTGGSAHLDSVLLILKDASGNQVDQMTLTLDGQTLLTIANGIFAGQTKGNITSCSSDTTCSNVNLSYNLSATINVASSVLSSCGAFKVYVVAYGRDSLNKVKVASDSASFERSTDYCAVSSSSVSSSSAAVITMVPFTATLSTEATGNAGIDLDSRTLYTTTDLSANANSVDIILAYKSKVASFENAESYGLSATASAQIAEETSGTQPNASTNALVFTYGSFTSSTLLTDDGSDGLLSNSEWVVKTPSYDASTMKGFFVIVVGAVITGSSATVPVTVWYVQ